jgi:ubiquinone biosynthesis protein
MIKCQPRNTPWRIARFVAEARIKYSVMHRTPKTWGEWVRHELANLGPAFIKMGQFLSTRSDLFDKEVITELAKLQDDITPIDITGIHHIMEESLGRPWHEVFTHIDETPIACASIGQVHTASAVINGVNKKVVIKVQKPCVAKQITDDIETLKNINKVCMTLGSPRAHEVENILRQYERFLSAELDYTQEMDHMIRFRELLDGSSVRIPEVYNNLCTSHILVMEYVPSLKISDMQLLKENGIATDYVAETLVSLFLDMIVTHGYVHCDPHPGNIGVLPDGETIVLYDFGNVIELSQQFRSEINHLIFAVFQRDVDEFVDILCKLKVFTTQDTSEIKIFFRSFFAYLETLDFKQLQASVKNQEFFLDDMSLKVDPDFLALFRIFSLLDGTCSRLDPSFNYIEALAPYTQSLFTDINFFDYKARKDIYKLQTYPAIMRSTEEAVVRTQKQVQQIALNTKYMEYLIMAFALTSQVDHVYSAPLYIMIFILWKIATS